MSTKRIESLNDCFRHAGGAIVECTRCRHWKSLNRFILPWLGLRSGMALDDAARRFRCRRCGAKAARVYPGDRPHNWRGNR